MFEIDYKIWNEALTKQLATTDILQEWQLPDLDVRTVLQRPGDDFWLTAPGIGGVRFNNSRKVIDAYPESTISRAVFDDILEHDWLPCIYPQWGIQVLHASAVFHQETRIVSGFVGNSGAGKSTLAYAFSEMPGWQQIADDSLAFRIDDEHIQICKIPDRVRLRPKSARYFELDTQASHTLNGFPENLRLHSLYFLDFQESSQFALENLDGVNYYLQLIEQAYCLNTGEKETRERLLKMYLELARGVSAYRLRANRDLKELPGVVENLASHALST